MSNTNAMEDENDPVIKEVRRYIPILFANEQFSAKFRLCIDVVLIYNLPHAM